MNKLKVDQRIKTNLFSADDKTVLAAIQEVKEKGNREYLPIIFDLLLTSPGMEIEVELTRLLGTVKDKDSAPAFVDAIGNEKYRSIQKQLLTACWQNGLDFSAFVPAFIKVITDTEWEVAFEAFTVIDNLETLPNEEIRKQEKAKIEKVLESATAQKEYLLRELLKILDLY